jgi:hypothetical protein
MAKPYGTILFSSPDFQNEFKTMSANRSNLSTKPKLNFTVPVAFDGTEVWKDYFIPLQNQMSCLSCWAFASTFVLSSRLAIYTQGKYKYTFSSGKMVFSEHWTVPQIKKHLTSGLSIDFSNHVLEVTKCKEESLLYAHQYLYRYGVPEISCVDDKTKLDNIYNSKQLFGVTYDVCPTNNTEMISHRAEGYYYVPGASSKDNKLIQGTEFNIRRDIYHWGPVSTVMKVFDDFLEWDGQGIYEWDGVSDLQQPYVGHAVVIVGWGTSDKNVPYWIVRNSWGNINGYFKIKRGTNHCEIEENVFVCYPSIPGIRLYLEYPILYHMDDYVIRGLWGIYNNGLKLTTNEKLILDKIEGTETTSNAFLYNPQYWVDFSRMIAGDESTFRYLVPSIEGFCDNDDKIIALDHSLSILMNILLLIIVMKVIFTLSSR